MSAQLKEQRPAFDVEALRKDFPSLNQSVNGKPLVYFDNAASSQTPRCVVDALEQAYYGPRANVHRGVHTLSQNATLAFENARESVRQFLNARSEREIIFTRGTTEALNLVAFCLGQSLKAGDEILITELEHHSNIVPWQMVTQRSGAKLVVVPINDEGEVTLDAFSAKLSSKTKVVSFSHVSNALGTILPVADMIRAAREKSDAFVVVDGAQGAPHLGVDVQALDCDFYTLSGHKCCGPTGIGVLYGKAEVLEAMPPYHGGGDMVDTVSFEKTTYAEIPSKFEAGTPDITGAIGLGRALDYLSREVGLENAARHEHLLLSYAMDALKDFKSLRVIGSAKEKAGVISFVVDGVHAHDLGTLLDQEGVAVRTGHHCAQPAMKRFGVSATTRVSFAFYNTHKEVDLFIGALKKALYVLGVEESESV